MKIIKPVIEVEPYDGVKIMKKIERACRNCYRSEGNITDDSYKKLITKFLCYFEKRLYLCTDSFHHASHLNSEPGWNFCF